MRRCIFVVCLCWVALAGAAQEDEAGKANRLIHEGKLLEALPLYEDLAKTHPDEWLYAEYLSSCLSAKAFNTADPAEAKALRTRARDEAKRAVELGDPNEYIKQVAAMDPAAVVGIGSGSPGGALLEQAERAFSTGDFPMALTGMRLPRMPIPNCTKRRSTPATQLFGRET